MKLIVIALIAAAFVLGIYFLAVSGGTPSNGSGLPSFVTLSPKIKEAYMFADEHSEVLNGVECYCGCMQHMHNGRIHKRGLLDCFKKEDGSYERHASACDMCINDALKVKELYAQGMGKDDIRAKIGSQYMSLIY